MAFYTSVHRMGANLLYRGYDNDGTRIEKKIKYSPHLYIKSSNGDRRALDGALVSKVPFETMSLASQHMKSFSDVDGYDIYGMTDFSTQYLQQTFPGDIKYNPDDVNVVSTDIEVHSTAGFPDPEKAEWPIDAVTMKSSKHGKYFIWTTLDAQIDFSELEEKGITRDQVKLVTCPTEDMLILLVLEWWNDPEYSPDIITGWHSSGFDIPYLVNRTRHLLGEEYVKQWSPWRIVKERKKFGKGGQEMQTYELYGIADIDYMVAFQKFGVYTYGPQESFKLDHIAHVVLDERKLSYDEYSGLHGLREHNPGKYLAYNIKDTWLISKFEDKTGIIDLIMSMAYKAGCNYEDTFGTTKIWDTIIYRRLDDQRIVIPPKPRNKKESFVGGYVKDVQVGMHDWVMSFDLNSLYPNIIVEYNMSPETVLEERYGTLSPEVCLKKDFRVESEHSVAANGTQFRKNKQGIIPEIIIDYYADRKSVKDKMLIAEQERESISKSDVDSYYRIEKQIARLNNAQMAAKILLNSLYGAMSNVWFRYFDIRIAEAITLSGQLAIKTAEMSINGILRAGLKDDKDRVVAMDTDSCYVNMSDIEKLKKEGTDSVEYLDAFAKKIVLPEIKRGYDNLFRTMNAYTPRMKMGREAIASRGFWTAKKKYALQVHNSEGVQYAKPKMKIMGIEAIKSSTPEVCRDWLKKSFEIIMEEDESSLQKYLSECRKSFNSLEIEEIAMPRGVSEIKKYVDKTTLVKKGTPINSRASIVYNTLLDMRDLGNKYPKIVGGDKIKYFHLKMPNPTHQNVIAFPDVLPREFDLDDYIDHETQFQKTFQDPLSIVLDAIEWNIEEKNSLEDFFA